MPLPRVAKSIFVCGAGLCAFLCSADAYSPTKPPSTTSSATAPGELTRTILDLVEQGDQLARAHKINSTRLALEKYEAALKYADEDRDPTSRFRALSAIGHAYDFLSEDQKALEFYRRALAVSFRTNVGDQMVTRNDIAALSVIRGENDVALAYAQQVIQIAKKTSDRAAEAQALYTQAEATYNRGNLRKALDYYNHSLSLWRQVQNRSKQAEVLIGLGYAFSNVSEPEKALASYKEALDLSKEANDFHMQAATYRGIGNLHTKQGEFQQALTSLFESLKLLDHYEGRLLKARVIAAIGYAYENIGETDRALDYDQQATEMFHDIGNRWGEAELRWDMGHLHFMRGDDEEAINQYEKALVLFTELKMPRFQAQTLRDLGVVYETRGEYDKAIDRLVQSLALIRSGQDQRHKASILTYLGRLQQRLGNPAVARDLYRQALPLTRQAADIPGEAFTLFNQARLELAAGKPQQARPLIERSLRLIENVRNRVLNPNLRAAYVGTIHEYYEVYVDVLMQSAKLDPSGTGVALAFEASEHAHARTFVESLREGRANLSRGVDAELLERQKSLEVALNTKAKRRMQLLAEKNEASAKQLSAELNSLTSQYEQLQVEIQSKNPRYAALTQPQPLTVSQIQQQVLDDDSVLLEYMLGEERSYVWAITRTEISGFELPPRAQIESAARKFRELLTANQPLAKETAQQLQTRLREADAHIPAAAATLGDLLTKPLQHKLGRKRLIIVPDGVLHSIPFQPLTVASPAGAATSEERTPLVANHVIVYEPSASALALVLNETRRPAQNAIAVFANPVFEADDSRVKVRSGGQSNGASEQQDMVRGVFRDLGLSDGKRVPALPASREEAEAIMSLVPWGTGLKAMGFDANRRTASQPELAQYRIIHFATHGFVDYEHPELSGLVLSLVDENGQPQDGYLRLYDIYNLKLSANLVVLSACNTALGKQIKGEGLIGLTRGFMYAGADGVVASLWKVDDDATAALIARFYEAMFVKGLPPAAALREAQLWMSQQERWRAPYFWAAFIIQGRYDQVQNVGFSSTYAQPLVAFAGVLSMLLLMACLAFGRRRTQSV